MTIKLIQRYNKVVSSGSSFISATMNSVCQNQLRIKILTLWFKRQLGFLLVYVLVLKFSIEKQYPERFPCSSHGGGDTPVTDVK